MNNKDYVTYWISSSEEDRKAMKSLFANSHYVWALFLGHLMLEKLLKAYYTQQLGLNLPRTTISYGWRNHPT